MEATGKCLCGAVTFTASNINPEMHACHCAMCRRWTGGPNLSLQTGRVTFNSGADLIKRYSSSEWAERGFCGECGSNLFYRMKGQDDYIMTLGSFDDSAGFHLHGEIYIDSKPSCYAFAGDHSRMTEAEFMASMGIELPPGNA